MSLIMVLFRMAQRYINSSVSYLTCKCIYLLKQACHYLLLEYFIQDEVNKHIQQNASLQAVHDTVMKDVKERTIHEKDMESQSQVGLTQIVKL